jgi:hypothetical protein
MYLYTLTLSPSITFLHWSVPSHGARLILLL